MTMAFESWLKEVREALAAINMPLEDWQSQWAFDFSGEFDAGTNPNDAAEKVNRFWWHQQNKAIGQHCRKTPNCWLPQNHQGECQNV